MATDVLTPITRVDVDAITWTPLVPAINGRKFTVLNTCSENLNIRTVSTDSSTELLVVPFAQQDALLSTGSQCFQIGTPVYYGKLAANTGTITILESL